MKRLLKLEPQFNSMTALEALKDGRKVRFVYWPSTYYIQYTLEGQLQATPDDLGEYLLDNPLRLTEMLVSGCYVGNWELYIEPT
jgi:hypothetical protein